MSEVMGDAFSAKDFRTWAGTLMCACALARSENGELASATARKRAVVAAIKETSVALGNTPSVCRSSYICPDVIESFSKGRTLKNYFSNRDELISYRGTKLHPAETALLRLLRRQ